MNAGIFLCGIPSSGKSTFGKWLQERKGFLHLDVQNPSTEDELTWAKRFFKIHSPNAAASFAEELLRLERPVVLDWGFPPHCLDLARALKGAGLKPWWLDGDRAAARRPFVDRGWMALKKLDFQLTQLEQHWTEIMALVGANVIATIDPLGDFLPEETIYQRMFGNL
jgi:hypothetical protein